MGPRQTRGLVLARPAVVEPVECGQGGTRGHTTLLLSCQPATGEPQRRIFISIRNIPITWWDSASSVKSPCELVLTKDIMRRHFLF